MNTSSAVEILKKLIDEIPSVAEQDRLSRAHQRWAQNCSFWLGRLFGPRSGILDNFNQLTWSKESGIAAGVPPWNLELHIEREHRKVFRKHLDIARGILESAMDQLEAVGLEQLRMESGYKVAANARQVFITHGHAEEVLRAIEDFVRALGFEPVVVKREPSLSGATDDVVPGYMRECIAQIILATSDDKTDGSYQPRLNVIHEIGLGQEILRDKMVYLKEKGCEFPSNVSPKIWESFTRENLAPAFEKIVKEFRGMGLI